MKSMCDNVYKSGYDRKWNSFSVLWICSGGYFIILSCKFEIYELWILTILIPLNETVWLSNVIYNIPTNWDIIMFMLVNPMLVSPHMFCHVRHKKLQVYHYAALIWC